MDRVGDFIGDRLRGHAIPADLRALVEMQLAGALDADDCPLPLCEVRVLPVGTSHSLVSEDLARRRQDRFPESAANIRAFARVFDASGAALVDGFNGDLFGYWLPAGQRASVSLPVVKVNSDAEIRVLGGGLVEAMVYDWIGDEDDPEEWGGSYAEDHAAITAFCRRFGLEIAASRADLTPPEVVGDPIAAHQAAYREELARISGS
jgi:hypothetical protein